VTTFFLAISELSLQTKDVGVWPMRADRAKGPSC
jgi:hypothetical protein